MASPEPSKNTEIHEKYSSSHHGDSHTTIMRVSKSPECHIFSNTFDPSSDIPRTSAGSMTPVGEYNVFRASDLRLRSIPRYNLHNLLHLLNAPSPDDHIRAIRLGELYGERALLEPILWISGFKAGKQCASLGSEDSQRRLVRISLPVASEPGRLVTWLHSYSSTAKTT